MTMLEVMLWQKVVRRKDFVFDRVCNVVNWPERPMSKWTTTLRFVGPCCVKIGQVELNLKRVTGSFTGGKAKATAAFAGDDGMDQHKLLL
jgi:hypothetical protein